jgi:uncharacterized protein (UPF0371 family)
MDRAVGFDNERYLRAQTDAIRERLDGDHNRLYLEFGGKLLYDYHAARVLPGFEPNVKMRLLSELSDQAEILLCIHAGAIERKKLRADFGITYDADAMKLIDDLRDRDLTLSAVVITRYEGQPGALVFKKRLERGGVPVYTHGPTKGYPTDVDRIVSEEGYGANEYIETTRPLVVVTGPGPGSGKLATCLNQMYHEHVRGIRSGFAKFETFPIWDLPLNHPVNVAYEAATAELGDANLIDPFHMEAYGVAAVNYNRDVEAFPVLREILKRVTDGESLYRSPTDMGVNAASCGIVDDEVVREAARQEVVRRYFRYSSEFVMGLVDQPAVERAERLMKALDLAQSDRRTVEPARQAALDAQAEGKGHDGIFCGAAIELKDGTIITGKNSPIMHAASSLLLNAVKHLAGVPDEIHLLAPATTSALGRLKTDALGHGTISLDVSETAIALGISAATSHVAQLCVEKLEELRGCDVHLTHIPTPGDAAGLRRLGVAFTSDPKFAARGLFVP